MALSDKQQRFVDEYLIDLNATQAAIRARYAANSAKVTGCRLLTNANVGAAIKQAQIDRANRTQIDADWVLIRLVAEAEADLADLFTADGRLKAVGEWPLIWRQGLVAGIDAEVKTAGGKEIAEVHKVRLSDRIKRIELIGKHVDVKAFVERREHTGKDGGPVEIKMTNRERAMKLARVLKQGLKGGTAGREGSSEAGLV
jgi:phage terminase small subunit